MKKTIAFAIAVVLFLACFAIDASAEVSQSWYCVRNSDHKQPIADQNMRYIEQYNGYYVDHKHGDDSKEKVIYLTFDAGYENGNVAKILDIMKEKNVKGAFFVLGNLILKDTALVKRMSNEGHLVCNHTNSHPDMTTIASKEEFRTELETLEWSPPPAWPRAAALA